MAAASLAVACGSGSERIIYRDDPNDPSGGNGTPGGGNSQNPGGAPGDGQGVRPAGCRKLGNEVKISRGGGGDSFALAWDTDHYLLAYSDPTQGNGDIHVVRLAADGSAQGPANLLDATPGKSRIPTIARTDGGFVVAWEDEAGGKTVRARKVDTNGVPVGDAVQVLASGAEEARPVVASTQGGVALAWMDRTGNVGSAFVGLLDANLGLRSERARLGDPAADASFPWVTSVAGAANNEGGTPAIWSDRRGAGLNIRFAEVDAAAGALRGERVVREASGDALLGRMIAGPLGYLKAWEDVRTEPETVHFHFSGPDGTLKAEGALSGRDGHWPNMAWGEGAAAVVYHQFVTGGARVFVTFLDAQGSRIGQAIQVSEPPDRAWSRFPAVAFTGSEYGVAWVDSRDGTPAVFLARVSCN